MTGQASFGPTSNSLRRDDGPGQIQKPAIVALAFDYSSDAMTEIGAFFRKSGRVIVPLTVREILDEQIAHKLA